ncbi:LysR family transcriptional regulator [Mycobacteroides abscessus subsp. abscessus]|nr:LysR family transcriptional regulator [Mycobacteroides abscessus subsp. abscessus]
MVGPGHKWAHRRKPVTLRELAVTPLLMREPGSGTRDTVWEVLSEVCQPATPAAELGSAAAIKAAAATGLAPAVLSRLIAGPELSAGSRRHRVHPPVPCGVAAGGPADGGGAGIGGYCCVG